MKDGFYNAIWGLGVRTLHLGKRAGVSGPFEHALEQIANRLIPAPTTESVVSLPSGMAMVVPPGFPRARSYAAGIYEPEVTHLVQRIVRDGMAVVDAGAFCGYYSLLASGLVGTSGKVYAFEPHPTSYAYLLRNVEANNCRNVVSVNTAVSNRAGYATMILDKQADHYWLTPYPTDSASITVSTVTLDDFFAQNGWPPVNLIKMDVEGSESAALEGMRELSQRNPEMQLIIENSPDIIPRMGVNAKDLAAILLDLGFCNGFIIEQGMRRFSVKDGLPTSHAAYDLLLEKTLGPPGPKV
jgi:FkbM family methyltransferase